MRSWAVIVILACGCGAPVDLHVARAGAPFACRGARAHEPAPSEAPSVVDPRAARRLEVRRLDGTEVPADLEAVRLRVIAEDAPFASVALAVAGAIGGEILIDPELVGRRVGVVVRDGDLEHTVHLLAESAGATRGLFDGALHFSTRARARERARLATLSGWDSAALEVRRIHVVAGSAPEVANAYCATLASPRGSAAAIGRSTVVASDVRERLDKLEELVGALER